jgi:nicotinamidase-related amidase
MKHRALVLLDLTEQTTTPEGIFGSKVDPVEALAAVCAASRAALGAARQAGDVVAWVVPGADFVRSMSGRELDARDKTLDPRVGKPEPGEPVISKSGIGGLAGGELQRFLTDRQVTTVALAGIATQYVVRLTAQEALAAELDVLVLEDCCADVSVEAHRGALDALRSSCTVALAAEVYQAARSAAAPE